MKLILFDIDGTLLTAQGLGSAATAHAMQSVFGTVGGLATFRFGGKTDWQMLLETLEGLVSPAEIQRRLPEYDAVLHHFMAELAPQYEVKPCLGAPDLLERCLGESAWTVGLLTANMPSGARVKLQAGGYDPDVFEVAVFGSEAPTRLGLPSLAVERAQALQRRQISPAEVLIIGDTPEDIACARAIGARVLAVATGRHSLNELAEHRPTYMLENLADVAQVWSLL